MKRLLQLRLVTRNSSFKPFAKLSGETAVHLRRSDAAEGTTDAIGAHHAAAVRG
ncbi:hypothetical protein ABIE45_002814 [Methylobacterium sp. OAE515]